MNATNGQETRIRGGGGHKRLSLAIALMILFGILFGLYRQKTLVANRLSALISSQYLKDSGYALRFRELGGNPFGSVTLVHPVLLYENGGEGVEVFSAERVEVDYDFRALFRLHFDASRVRVVRPRVEIPLDSSGRPELPSPFGAGGPPGEKAGGGFHLSATEIRLEELTVRLVRPEGVELLRNIDLQASLEVKGGTAELEVLNLRGDLPMRGVTLERMAGRLALTRNRLEATDLSVRLGESRIGVTGSAGLDGGQLDLSFLVDPVVTDEVEALTGRDLGIDGRVNAQGSLSGTLDSLQVGFGGSGTVDGHRLEEARGLLLVRDGRFEFTELAGRINGARVDGRALFDPPHRRFVLEGHVEDFDLSSGFVGEGAPRTRWRGRARVERTGDLITFDASLGRGHFEDFPIEALEGGGRFDGRTVTLEAIRFRSPGLEGDLAGAIEVGGKLDLFFDVECGDAAVLTDYFDLPPELNGTLQANGRVEGSVTDTVDVLVHGPVETIRFQEAVVDSGHLGLAVQVSPQRTWARVEVSGRDLSLWGLPFTNPSLSLEADEEILRFRSFRFSRGDTTFRAAGVARPVPSGTDVLLDEVALGLGGELWTNEEPVRLERRGDRWVAHALALHSPRGSLDVSGWWSPESGELDVSALLDGLDLALPARLIPYEPPVEGPPQPGIWRSPGAILGGPRGLTGRADGELRLAGSLERPEIEADVTLREVRVDTLTLGILHVRGGYREGRWTVERGGLVSAWGNVDLEGHVDLPVSFAKERDREEKRNEEPAVDLQVRFERLQPGRWLGLFREDLHFLGLAEGSLHMTGPLEDPRTEFRADLEGGFFRGYDVPRLTVEAVLGPDSSRVKEVVLHHPRLTAKMAGGVPLGFSLSSGLRLDREGELNLHVTVSPGGDLAFLTEFEDLFAEASGSVKVDFTLRGTPLEPRFRGRASVRSGVVRLAGMEERYWDLQVDAVLSRDSVVVQSIRGREGKEGRFQGSGLLLWDGLKPGSYVFRFPEVRDFFLGSVADLQALGDGRIEVSSTRLAAGGTVPRITGYAFCKRAVLSMEFGGGRGEGDLGGTVTPTWLCDLRLDAPQNVWLKNREANVELGGRDLRLIRDEEGLRMRGTLRALKGTYTIYNNQFRITYGEFDFTRAVGLVPNIHVEAEMPNPSNSSETFYLTLIWEQDPDHPEPQISLRSDAGYSETDIWKMLGGGVLAEGESGWDPSGAAVDLTLNYLERVLESQLGGVSVDLQSKSVVGRGTDPTARERETTVALGRYLAQGLYLKYKQGLSLSTDRQIELEYRIWDRFLIRTEVTKYEERVLRERYRQPGEEINLDFKIRWEW
jgi:hypothetical protein